jgi:hypothetical protein
VTALTVGDRVRLVALDDGFFADMDDDVIEFLRSCIGVATRIAGLDQHGHAELVFVRSRDPYVSHTIWIDPSRVERVAP